MSNLCKSCAEGLENAEVGADWKGALAAPVLSVGTSGSRSSTPSMSRRAFLHNAAASATALAWPRRAQADAGDLGLIRANTVRGLLVQVGLDPSTIEVRSHGESDLLVKTPDETPEPRNRRVEISVR